MITRFLNYQRIRLHILRQIWIIKGVKILSNSFIEKNTDITNPKNVSIGENSNLYKNITIHIKKNGKFSIGDFSHIAPYGYMLIDNNSLTIGNNVAVGPFCSFFCHSHNINGNSTVFTENYIDASIIIGNNVFIGSHSVILPGVIINDNIVVAANSVVRGVLESNSVYAGSPVKKIKSI